MIEIHHAIAGDTKLDIKKVPKITIVGPPGSGKSSVAKFLAEEFLAHYLHIGSLLRRYKSEYEAKLDAGDFGSDEDVIRVVYDHTYQINTKDRNLGVEKAIIIDSFPRTVGQYAEGMYQYRTCPFNLIINLAVSNQEVLLDRILNRTEVRKDDDREIAIQRLKKHNELSNPAIKLIKNSSVTVHTLRAGEGRSLNNVQEDALMVARVFAAGEYARWSKLKFQDRQRCYNLMKKGKLYKKYYR